MADIELVIKIPEELKNKIDNANEDNYRTYIWWFETTLYCAIKSGTPLPKGQGRLMILSEDEVKRELTFLNFSCQNWISEVGLWNATLAIIEADKEQET